jgi:hypothetical protein
MCICWYLISWYCIFLIKVAQQEAQRAAFVVDRAIQEKQQKIVQVRLFISLKKMNAVKYL